MLQVGVVAVFLFAATLYATPTAIAVLKGRRTWPLVAALNIPLGWTIVGWLVALAVALDLKPRRPAWMRWTRRRRVKPQRLPEVVATALFDDPPEMRENPYAAWLDDGAAMPPDTHDR